MPAIFVLKRRSQSERYSQSVSDYGRHERREGDRCTARPRFCLVALTAYKSRGLPKDAGRIFPPFPSSGVVSAPRTHRSLSNREPYSHIPAQSAPSVKQLPHSGGLPCLSHGVRRRVALAEHHLHICIIPLAVVVRRRVSLSPCRTSAVRAVKVKRSPSGNGVR
jgi:hypothetical protein